MNDMTKLKGYTARELLNLRFPAREDILEPWLRTEETALIWAPSGVGKTFLSLSIALAVAGAGSVGDWAAPKARKVVLYDGEMNQGDIQARIAFLLESGAVKVSDQEVALGNLRIIPRQAQEIGQDFLDLTDADHQQAIIKTTRGKAEMVIFDNLTTMSDNLSDENDASQFKALQTLFMELKRAGIVGLLVHHANKGGKQARGSTALETTFEVILGLHRVLIAPPGRATFKTDFGKFRARGDNRLQKRLWTLEDHGWVIGDAEPEEGEVDPVLKALKSLECTTQAEIATVTGLSGGYVSKRLKKLRQLGELKEEETEDWFMRAKVYRAELAGEGFEDIAEEDF